MNLGNRTRPRPSPEGLPSRARLVGKAATPSIEERLVVVGESLAAPSRRRYRTRDESETIMAAITSMTLPKSPLMAGVGIIWIGTFLASSSGKPPTLASACDPRVDRERWCGRSRRFRLRSAPPADRRLPDSEHPAREWRGSDRSTGAAARWSGLVGDSAGHRRRRRRHSRDERMAPSARAAERYIRQPPAVPDTVARQASAIYPVTACSDERGRPRR